MSDYITYSAEQCLSQETLFLVRVSEQQAQYRRLQPEPVGSIIKIDLRRFGHRGGYSYDSKDYREANGAEKLLVISGKRDVIIQRG